MKKIYIVTEGEWSDYHICAPFSKEKDAILFTKKFKNKHTAFNIEEWIVDNENFKKYDIYFIRMKKNGDVDECELENRDYNYRCTMEKRISFDVSGNMFVSVFAKNEKHAIKIVNEKRIQILAENNWGKPQW